jgi:hypothetical protein
MQRCLEANMPFAFLWPFSTQNSAPCIGHLWGSQIQRMARILWSPNVPYVGNVKGFVPSGPRWGPPHVQTHRAPWPTGTFACDIPRLVLGYAVQPVAAIRGAPAATVVRTAARRTAARVVATTTTIVTWCRWRWRRRRGRQPQGRRHHVRHSAGPEWVCELSTTAKGKHSRHVCRKSPMNYPSHSRNIRNQNTWMQLLLTSMVTRCINICSAMFAKGVQDMWGVSTQRWNSFHSKRRSWHLQRILLAPIDPFWEPLAQDGFPEPFLGPWPGPPTRW